MNGMMNFFMNMMKSGTNPEQMMLKFLNDQNTPFSKNLMNMIQKGDTKGIEQVARNMCQQRGVDFDKEFNSFRRSLKI